MRAESGNFGNFGGGQSKLANFIFIPILQKSLQDPE